uniref:GPI inositol-deacylase n=1 Tax=Helicotheca tamesis TaxID=374047 RepID=A0A7S2E418_9STRA|mmetsp:Transcript_12421/g.17120  ORF Transcript_12421/g.17120 Transcript_12421/m.17120 type:complete len:330 (+) Transcript_12421:97-1086(+)|eukprot:CAMPEP_0185730652 /NCGR_PEP_ID=MMETSP1171-20130828/10580_1 /TAXON_ID=374046 /ORGANISM="Helicotheca tamensis, Strain CCMP826" /LENGTH=329 /DNA_ID=CAMNT_0028399751 /DNA_START=15 /DNA_END=1004 /DNA_ORIENTATION=-
MSSDESSDNIFGEERILGKNKVRVFIASRKRLGQWPTGITFLLTAANIPLSKYLTIRDALLSTNQMVVGYMINALNPPIGNHRHKAQNVRDVFDELQTEVRGIDTFDIVGHSVGGKIALLVAALHNDDNVIRNVIALDPVDQSPVEFTRAKKEKCLSLPGAKAKQPSSASSKKMTSIKSAKAAATALGKSVEELLIDDHMIQFTLTHTDTGFFVKNEHNARAIHKFNPHTKLINHRNAGHMCYCDDDDSRVSWKAVMNMANNGNPDRNRICKEETIAIIKNKNVRSSVGKGLKNAKKDVVDSFKDFKKDAEGVARGGMASVMGKKMMGF